MDVLPFLLFLALAAGAVYAIVLYRRSKRPLDENTPRFGGGGNR